MLRAYPRLTLIRFETESEVQMQVDWIEFQKDGLSAFVATIGYSRASYVEYVADESRKANDNCHLALRLEFRFAPVVCRLGTVSVVL